MLIPEDVRAAFGQSLEREAQSFEEEMVGFIRSQDALHEQIRQTAIRGLNDALHEHLPGKHRQKDHASGDATTPADNPRGDIRAEFDRGENKAAGAFLTAGLKQNDGSPIRKVDDVPDVKGLSGKVKDEIVRKIIGRVKDNPTFKDAVLRGETLAEAARAAGPAHNIAYGDIIKRYKDGRYSADDALMRIEQTGIDLYKVRYSTVNSMVQRWAGTSGDNEARSIAAQAEAKEEFGLKDATTEHLPLQQTATVLQPEKAAMRVVLRAQYDITQEALKKANIEYVTLYRGVKEDKGSALSKAIGATPVATSVNLQPMSSFSAESGTARDFAGLTQDRDSAVMAARVHRSQILSTARTGFGCLFEGEYVVLGGVANVIAWRPSPGGLGANKGDLAKNFGIKKGEKK